MEGQCVESPHVIICKPQQRDTGLPRWHSVLLLEGKLSTIASATTA